MKKSAKKSSPSEKPKAYREGKYSAENGVGFGHNPYAIGDPNRRLWQDGWQDHFLKSKK